MKKFFNIVTIIVIYLSLASCVSHEIAKTPVFEDYEANPTLNDASVNIDKVVDDLPKKTTIVRSEAIKTKLQTGIIQTKLSDQDKAKVMDQILNISKSQDLIFKTAVDIDDIQKDLVATQGYLKQAKTQITKMEEAFKASISAKDEIDKKLQEALDREKGVIRYIIYCSVALCMIGFAVGAGLIYFGNPKLGSGILVISLSTLIISITLDQFWSYIPWVGLGIICVSIGIIVWKLMIKDKAIDEVVATTEVVKEALAPETRKELFGSELDKGKIHNLQSKSTEEMVKSRRDRLKKPQDGSVIDSGSQG
jgi:hypothetical protein